MKRNPSINLNEYSDEELFTLANRAKLFNQSQLTEIIDELLKRGYSSEVEKIITDLIRLKPIYSKFWARVFSHLIDIIILGIFGTILGAFMGSIFSRMGENGKIVGFIIATVYLSLGNSKIFRGQTIGKKLLKLKVVDTNSNEISFTKSLFRTGLYLIPLFFINYIPPGFYDTSILVLAKQTVFGTFLLVFFVHFLVNNTTRQTICDQIFGTYVINTQAYQRQELEESQPVALIVSCFLGFFVLVIGLITSITQNVSSEALQGLTPIKEQINQLDDVNSSILKEVSASYAQFGVNDNVSNAKYLMVNLFVNENHFRDKISDDIENIKVVHDAIKIILKDYPEANNMDYIVITLTYGYNIGIARLSRSIHYSNTPLYWSKKVNKNVFSTSKLMLITKPCYIL
ncbi:RDD family protein [Puteibacter caeruleilacunae]|nr:RDD family protein [Puteibacter caeruleilacunae]